jgi:release factor glutamine methyltransferase
MKVKTNLLEDVKSHYLKELGEIYGEKEALSLLNILIDHFFGLSRTDQLLQKDFRLTETELLKIHFAVKELKKEKPVQYITGETEFYGMKIKVNPSVLIPRPETEELVDRIVKGNRKRPFKRILDIGTGSGCIALALKKAFPEAQVTAIDVSNQALDTARANSKQNSLEVDFRLVDILDRDSGKKLPDFDVIVSNPPYVTEKEKALLKKNVIDHEPHTALFVGDEDPLLFYRAITEFAVEKLKENGQLWFEINENYGNDVAALLKDHGLRNVRVIKDLFGKERMAFGER